MVQTCFCEAIRCIVSKQKLTHSRHWKAVKSSTVNCECFYAPICPSDINCTLPRNLRLCFKHPFPSCPTNWEINLSTNPTALSASLINCTARKWQPQLPAVAAEDGLWIVQNQSLRAALKVHLSLMADLPKEQLPKEGESLQKTHGQ
jgi:hypothetical protein